MFLPAFSLFHRWRHLAILLAPFLILSGCNKRITNGNETSPPGNSHLVPAFGSSTTLEIATWNLENFPKAGPKTVNAVAQLMEDLDIDIFALQEIADTTAFRQLLAELNDYQGIYSPDVYWSGSYQKTAVVYRQSLVQLLQQQALFQDDSYSFPRPPLQATLVANLPDKSFDFRLIVVHLKASGGSTNEQRRRSAVRRLHDYLDTEISQGADPDFVVAGDWNDDLLDDDAHNIFLPFLNQPQMFIFLTLPLAQNGEYSYLKTYLNLIDHILITRSVQEQFPRQTVKVLHLDEYLTDYLNTVSDHRPVAVRFGNTN